jgi:ATP-dependent DNA helicase RecG
LDQGVVERVGRGKFILSRKFYDFARTRGVYTRKRGLDRETNKALLLKHIEDNQNEGSPLAELLQVLPGLSRPQVQTLLRELRREGKSHPVGKTKAGRWYPGPDLGRIASESSE